MHQRKNKKHSWYTQFHFQWLLIYLDWSVSLCVTKTSWRYHCFRPMSRAKIKRAQTIQDVTNMCWTHWKSFWTKLLCISSSLHYKHNLSFLVVHRATPSSLLAEQGLGILISFQHKQCAIIVNWVLHSSRWQVYLGAVHSHWTTVPGIKDHIKL